MECRYEKGNIEEDEVGVWQVVKRNDKGKHIVEIADPISKENVGIWTSNSRSHLDPLLEKDLIVTNLNLPPPSHDALSVLGSSSDHVDDASNGNRFNPLPIQKTLWRLTWS